MEYRSLSRVVIIFLMCDEYDALRLKVFLCEILRKRGDDGAGAERTYFFCEIATF